MRTGIAWEPASRRVARPAEAAGREAGSGRGGRRGATPSGGLLQLLDLCVVLATLLLVWMFLNAGRMPQGLNGFLEMRLSVRNVLLLTGFVLAWRSVSLLLRVYGAAGWREQAARVVAAASVGSAALLALPTFSASGSFGYRTILVFWLAVVPGMLLLRLSLPATLRAISPSAPVSNVLIVGSGPRAYRLYQRLTTGRRTGHLVLGFVDSGAHASSPEVHRRLIGTLEQLEPILMQNVVDEVLIALPIKSCYDEIQRALCTCERVGIKARYLADVFRHDLAQPRYEISYAAPVVTLSSAPEDSRLPLKRCIDIVGSLAGLVLFAPLLLAIAAVIRLTSPGPVLFVQQRYGLNKRLFPMYKFRTMVADAETLRIELEALNEASGPRFKITNDPRITPLGRVLRRTSLDELPQLLNVLRGEMSLVGPRPLPISDVHRFSEGWLMRRFSVRPGLTGLWQVSGRCNLESDAWVELDLQYIDQWSLALDWRILLRTVPAVVKGAGAV